MQKIVYDSGFGYDLGSLIGKISIEGFVRISLLTGKYAGQERIVTEDEIKPYAEYVLEEMKLKYKYDQTVQLQN